LTFFFNNISIKKKHVPFLRTQYINVYGEQLQAFLMYQLFSP